MRDDIQTNIDSDDLKQSIIEQLQDHLRPKDRLRHLQSWLNLCH